MPIYEYRCKECHQVFEKWRKHVEDETVSHSCPICKGAAERLISHSTFALKGGGWYVTEYGSRKREQAAEGKAGEDSCTTAAAGPAAKGCDAPCGKAPACGEKSGPAAGTVSPACLNCAADARS